MYNQQNQVERIQMEMALRQNQKAMNMPQMGGDAAYGSQPTHQKFESRNPLTGATDEYIKENAEPSKRPPNNIIHGGSSELVDNKICAKVGQNMTQQQALQYRSNSLVAKYRQKKEKEQADQVYFDNIFGKGTPQQRNQVQRQGSSNNQSDQNRIFPSQDYARSSSENHLNRGKAGGQQQVVDQGRVAGIASKVNKNNTDLIAMSGQNETYQTSAQIYGKGMQSKQPTVNIGEQGVDQYPAQMPSSGRNKNGSSNDFVLGNPAYAEDQAVLNSRRQKPPRAPVVQGNLTMDVQAQRNAGHYAAQRNKQSSVFN